MHMYTHIWTERERERDMHTHTHSHIAEFHLNKHPQHKRAETSWQCLSAAQYDAASDGHHHPDDLAGSNAD